MGMSSGEESQTVSDRCEDFPPALAVAGRGADRVEVESPSLFAGGGGPTAYEMKFLLTEEQAREVAVRVSTRLALDPYADPALDNGYLITSVYTDTPDYDVLRRTGASSRKYRARGYGIGGPVFVERKTKRGDEVRKRRNRVPSGDLSILDAVELAPDWPGEWFRRQTANRRLRPVCRISYERVAYMGPSDGGAIRVTFDRRVRGAVVNGWEVAPVDPAPGLLDGRVICEFKFRVAMPGLLKGVIEGLGLCPSSVSKYRLFMETVMPPAVGGVTNA